MNPFGGDARGYGAGAALAKLAAALVALAALAGAAAAEVRILAFGDLLTAGYGLPEGEGFVPRLDAWLAAHGAADVDDRQRRGLGRHHAPAGWRGSAGRSATTSTR